MLERPDLIMLGGGPSRGAAATTTSSCSRSTRCVRCRPRGVYGILGNHDVITICRPRDAERRRHAEKRGRARSRPALSRGIHWTRRDIASLLRGAAGTICSSRTIRAASLKRRR